MKELVSGFKHWSHAHNLVIHQTNQAAKMSCNACDALVTGTIYACWECKFVLHEQCFHATRSLKHPSHPSHPLTLVPYPTYPSNSFYCDSCKLTGNGVSYSCSDCEFDLHVHCALSTPGASHGQGMVPKSGQNSYVAQNAHTPTGTTHNPNPNLQYSSVAPTMPEEESDSDREQKRTNQQRLEALREQYRLEALGRQYALDLI